MEKGSDRRRLAVRRKMLQYSKPYHPGGWLAIDGLKERDPVDLDDYRSDSIAARSSRSSVSVAAILARLKSSMSSPWTIS